MIKKLVFIFRQHFIGYVLLNTCFSCYVVLLFYEKGFEHINLYNLGIAIKLVGYAITIIYEKLFLANREFHFKNLGFSYRKLFGFYFALDFLQLVTLLLICKLWQNYL